MSRKFEEMRRLLAADVLDAAPRLLGWHLVSGELRARIVEVEAYRQDDPGCHAFRGKTNRNAVMFGEPGHAYVYFTYGNHWMLNVVAHPPGDASAVLIRAAEPLEGLETMRLRRPKAANERGLLSGPGKLCAAYGITGGDNGIDLLNPDSPLRLEPHEPVTKVLVGTRIGLAMGKGDDYPWRFAAADALPWISRPLQGLTLR